MSAAKINLSPINQGVMFAHRHYSARLTRETPTVKSGETRILSFNGAPQTVASQKSADPTCYNVSSVGNRASGRLFDIVRTA